MRKMVFLLFLGLCALAGCAGVEVGRASPDAAGVAFASSNASASAKVLADTTAPESATSVATTAESMPGGSEGPKTAPPPSSTSAESAAPESSGSQSSPGQVVTGLDGKILIDGVEFFDYYDGTYLRWASDAEFTCDDKQTSGCWGIIAFSAGGCSGGVRVDLSIVDEKQKALGDASGVSTAIPANSQALIVIGDPTGYQGDPEADVKSAACVAP
ncbi:hypothetical protein EH165_01965 [Nakamurella antarctica]|uniref:Lipoprotein n=1 Tax=Nakamurella antarctica TaxID=1902245 RepID=A0A3G8ZRD9_9ACTN|nr:hypothetical protein [Nakamurella antarctica]AZI57114.1 hypothetical protein EH165_01965 [Nakamurella antarctica]